MGFLRRVLGGGTSSKGSGAVEGSDSRPVAGGDARAELGVTSLTRVREDAALHVVGETHRQGLLAMARQPGAGDLPEGVPAPPPGYYKALLLPEPTNQYDRNAIRVLMWAGATWALSGYLSRETAAAFQPLFRHLGRDGKQPAIACDAALIDERGDVGVVLHLGSPGECIAELITDDRQPAAHPWAGQLVVFTGTPRVLVTGVSLDRAALLVLARWAGCEVLPRVTKKAQLLVTADPHEISANTQKARDYGIPIVPEADFLVGIGLPPEAVSRDAQPWATPPTRPAWQR